MRTVGLIGCTMFLAACTDPQTEPAGPSPELANVAENAPAVVNNAVAQEPVPDATPTQQSAACRTQDGKAVAANAIRAIGTEPFWGAQVDGRCVTYSTPEDQQGTRVWAKFSESPAGRVWTGALRGKPFQLTVKPAPGCSDGMSDRTYPEEAILLVDGETRRGCAQPL